MPDLLDAQGIFAVFGPYAIALALVLTRITALIATTPLFASPLIPPLAKAGLIAVLTAFVLISTDPPAPAIGLDVISLTGAIIREAIVGAIMGLSVTVAFGALHFCGQLIGIQMGFAIANVVDPVNFEQVGVVAQLLNLLGLLLFLAFDGHLLILRALFDSYQHVPIGTARADIPAVVDTLIAQGALLFSLGLRLALPVVAVVLLVNVGLAAIARTVPQVNIFVIGFLLTIGIGLVVLGLAVPATAHVFEDMIEDAIRTSVRLSRAF
ncbi:MAG: flagellar biosynthetic protein FliR [Myxococcales bacterium]|nr:flagellar biosynthetic protein FliR [Myxococcales bacterium]MCB9553205.1 flagellar biosynthetic protein FliR [Myxococcales bacterium]